MQTVKSPFHSTAFSDTTVERMATIESFIEALKAQNGLVDKFEVNLWVGLMDFVTVYSKDDVRFTFKNGTEIKA